MPYDPTLLLTSELQQVRYLLGGAEVDTLVADAEISFALSKESNVYYAAARCADSLAAKHTGTAYTRSVGPLTLDGRARRDSWYDLAQKLREQGKKSFTFDRSMLVGISVAEKVVQDTQTEFPQFNFEVGMHDNAEGTQLNTNQ